MRRGQNRAVVLALILVFIIWLGGTAFPVPNPVFSYDLGELTSQGQPTSLTEGRGDAKAEPADGSQVPDRRYDGRSNLARANAHLGPGFSLR